MHNGRLGLVVGGSGADNSRKGMRVKDSLEVGKALPSGTHRDPKIPDAFTPNPAAPHLHLFAVPPKGRGCQGGEEEW
jgi:hypothetical protein